MLKLERLEARKRKAKEVLKAKQRDFRNEKFIRAYGQRANMSKPSGKEDKKDYVEFKTSLHKLTI